MITLLASWRDAVRVVVFLTFALFAQLALAVPGDYTITPTFTAPAEGTPTGYNMYEGCDVLDQTLAGAVLVGAVTSGQAMTITGDSTVALSMCIVPFDATGNFPFDTVLPYIAEGRGPVGDFNLNCSFVATVPDGNQYTCIQK